ncbi:hypothetical protein BHS06_21055 [Myxococcus xanthus]|uniref:hypothetical protein n=1 Tax=Myxococcus xanthus TaxID=34 RepID=UPI00112A4360|nr:hypothetical protein [Myxococcus xanthus]QDE91264.1 hypothetical protein BHS06_21055 [Myxococcus xanthus]
MSAHVVEVVPASSGARRIILVSIDWTRDKGPRLPLGHASIVAALRKAGADVRAFSFAISLVGFNEEFILRGILDSAKGRKPEQVDVSLGVFIWNDHVAKRLLVAIRRKGFQGRIVSGGPQIS